jgi:hypothetical protein
MTVFAKFSDESVLDVTREVVWTPKSLSLGDTFVIGSYTLKGTTKTITVDGIVVNSNSAGGCAKSSSSILTIFSLLAVLGIVILKKKD